MKTITTHSNNNITRFLEMNWEENRNFCKEIGVQALPMVKMFTKDGEVETFPCGPKKVELLRAKVKVAVSVSIREVQTAARRYFFDEITSW